MNTELTLSQAINRAPSIGAHRPSMSVSDKYKPINTVDVLRVLLDKGWIIQSANQARAMNLINRGFTKHVITLKHPEFQYSVGGLIPTLNVVNSHNATSALKLFWGLFRMVCSNGLIIGEKTYEAPRVIHVGQSVQSQVQNTLIHLDKHKDKMLSDLSLIKRTEFTPIEAFNLAKAAVDARWGNIDKMPERAFDDGRGVVKLLYCRRSEDVGVNAWHVFNRIQENILKGIPQTGIRRVSAIDTNVKINRELWDKTVDLCRQAA